MASTQPQTSTPAGEMNWGPIALPNVVNPNLYPGSQISYQHEGGKLLMKFRNDPTPEDGQDNGSTVWLYDTTAKTYTPIMSWQALKAYFPGKSDQELTSRINVVDSVVLNDDSFKGQFLGYEYGIKGDGTSKTYHAPSGSGFTNNKYGQKQLSSAEEKDARDFVGGIMSLAVDRGVISQATYDSYFGSAGGGTLPTQYANAYLYGDYTPNDLLRDLRAKQDGLDVRGIDTNLAADQFYQTAAGQASRSNQALDAAIQDMGVSAEVLDRNAHDPRLTGLAKELGLLADPTSPEFRAEADKIQAGWYDIVQKQTEASTEQEKAAADADYADFRKTLETRYGIQLSNSARQAWGQIEQLTEGFANRNLGNSGMLQEATDMQLNDVRRSNENLRTMKTSESETASRKWLRDSASSQQVLEAIKKMDAEDTANGVAPTAFRSSTWGLKPSSETANYFTDENLKKVYPNISAEDMARVRGQMTDTGGNYRSGLYQRLYDNKYRQDETRKTSQGIALQTRIGNDIENEKKQWDVNGGNGPFSSSTGTPAETAILAGSKPAVPTRLYHPTDASRYMDIKADDTEGINLWKKEGWNPKT